MDTTKASRNQAIEWLKLLAIISIAFQHTSENIILVPLVTLTHFAVPAFVLVSCWFAYDGGRRQKGIRNLLETGAKRFLLLYGLFLIWNSMILALRIGNDLFVSKVGAVSFDVEKFLLSGYGNALWFLPFIAGANLLCFCVGYWVGGAKSRLSTAAIAGMGLGLALLLWAGFGKIPTSNYFLSISRKAIPSVFLVIGFRSIILLFPNLIPRNAARVSISIALVTLGAWGIFSCGRDLFLWETLMGVGVTMLATCVSPAVLRPLDPNLCLWIYLAHAPIIQTTKDLLHFTGSSWPSGSTVTELLAFSVFIGVLICGYWILGLIRPLKRFLLLTNAGIKASSP